MCFKTPKIPDPKPVPLPPSRDTAAEAGSRQRKRLTEQQGVYGNIFTSALGDSTYGGSTRKVAVLGGGI